MTKYDEQALNYLRSKFPGEDEKIFHTDYNGRVHTGIIEAFNVFMAGEIDKTCKECKGSCALGNPSSRPVAVIKTSQRGYKYLSVGFTCDMSCRFNPLSGQFGRMFRASGLINSQLDKTFKNYEARSKELVDAKSAAINAAHDQTGLILAGTRGTGKTHLAIAIALYAMKHNRQAIFRLVNDLLEELRQSVREDNFSEVISRFKEVPVLILDDLGKERTTDAGLDYLYQIVDFRYRHNLQTIITTNAPTIQELEKWGAPEYLTPMCSRILENGSWVSITNAQDWRVK
ncbi:MAG: ATP-binding protein [Synergistaceae bacterium]|nr:ATP-binding protein [Synergistaceae bacterium]